MYFKYSIVLLPKKKQIKKRKKTYYSAKENYKS